MDLEKDLLISLCKTETSVGEISPDLFDKVNWDLFLAIADEHRVIPLVFQRVEREFSDRVPKHVLEEMGSRFRMVAAINMARASQLISLAAMLSERGIDLLTYKGFALAQIAYDDIAMRQFTDIDLFVRKRDVPEIKAIMAGHGCRPAWEMTEKQEEAVLRCYYEYPFFCGDTNTLVELHWEFTESFFVFEPDPEGIWDRACPVDLYGHQLPTLSAEDRIIVLSAHGCKHFFRRLAWICDIDRVVRNSTIDWHLVESLAQDADCERMVRLGLFMSADILGTPLPPSVSSSLYGEKHVGELGEYLRKMLFSSDRVPSDWIDMTRMHIKMRRRFSTKLKYCSRLLRTKVEDKLFMPMGRPR